MTQIRLTKKIPPGFSLDVEIHPARGVTAIHGPSGAGKTLLLELTAGLVAPDAGRILLDDAIVYDAGSRVHIAPGRRGCGYLSQADSLFPHMTVRQNVAFAAQRFPRLDRVRRVTDIMERCGLAGDSECRPGDLDRAARLRCAIARALVGEPRLLLADDAGIDEPLLRLIRGIFAGPILLVTGDLDLCCAVAEELMILHAGRIEQRGVPRTIFEQPGSVEVARILGIPNLFAGTVAALDRGRNLTRLDFKGFTLSAPYLPGHFKGDRISVAIRPNQLRIHPGTTAPGLNFIRAELLHVSERTEQVRLEFAGSIFVDVSHPEFQAQSDNKEWQVEFPPENLRIL